MRTIKAVWTLKGLRQAVLDLTENGVLFLNAPLDEAGSTLKLVQLKQYLRKLRVDARFERRDSQWVNVYLKHGGRS